MLKRLLSLEPCNMHMALTKGKTCTWTASGQQNLTQRYDFEKELDNHQLGYVTFYIRIMGKIITGKSSKESSNVLVQ